MIESIVCLCFSQNNSNVDNSFLLDIVSQCKSYSLLVTF
jgi:hypothetical protein